MGGQILLLFCREEDDFNGLAMLIVDVIADDDPGPSAMLLATSAILSGPYVINFPTVYLSVQEKHL